MVLEMNVVGFFGDLHLGNLFTDVDGVLELAERVMKYADERVVLVFVGDVIEGTNKYRTQIYKMFNVEPLRVQLDYLSWFINTLFDKSKEVGVRLKIHIVLGNHDLGYDYGNLIKFIRKRGLDVSYDSLLIRTERHRILCKHQLNRGSRGSYLTWWSGYLLNLGEKLLFQHNADILVTAHTHRPDIAIVNRDDKFFVGLPAYIVSNEDYKFNKIVVYMDGWMRIDMVSKRPRNLVMRENLRKMSEIVGVEPLLDEVSI